MGEKSSDLESLCRTCMSACAKLNVGNSSIVPERCIYEKTAGGHEGPTIVDLLQSVQPLIQIHIEDRLPKIICFGCTEQLRITYDFLQMYKQTDEKFRKLLKEVDTFDDAVPLATILGVKGKKEHNERYGNECVIAKFEIEMDKAEDGHTNVPHPEFEAMFIHNRSDGEDEVELYDNPFGNASDEDDGNWTCMEESIKKSSKKTSLKKRKAKINKTSKLKAFKDKKVKKIDVHLTQPPPPPLLNEDGSITCQECEKVLTNVTLWQEHMLDHRSGKITKKRGRKKGIPKRFECENCGKVFQRRSVYNTHVLTHTAQARCYRCIECGKKFKSYGGLNTHMLCHKGERFECEKCGKGFPNVSDYNDHVLTHKDDQPLMCLECGKNFKSSLGLSTHILRHRGEKNFQCPHCPRKFVVRSGLYGHIKQQHEEGKPFLCDICGKSFRMADMLKSHKRWHNDKKYTCEYCDKRFVTMEKQRRHMRTHTGEKPYRCKYCNRAYAQSNDCNKHMKQHLGENIYQCELCPLRFPLVRDVRAHFVSHKDDDEETRDRNLEARALEEKILKIKLGIS